MPIVGWSLIREGECQPSGLPGHLCAPGAPHRGHSPAGMEPVEQRWNAGHIRWARPDRPLFNPAGYTVDTATRPEAAAFVHQHHYSKAYPAAKKAYKLRDPDGMIVGVAVFAVPASAKVLTGPFPNLEPYVETIELSRLVLHDAVPFNAESWFVAQCHHDLAAIGVRGVVSFSDPLQRTTHAGTIVMPGHVGTIYQALNFTYTGRGTARRLTILPDGTVLSDRAAQKIRARERGHDYAQRILTDLGAEPLRPADDPTVWLHRALDTIGARRVAHPGNHRYCLTLGRRNRRHLVLDPQPYPTAVRVAAAPSALTV